MRRIILSLISVSVFAGLFAQSYTPQDPNIGGYQLITTEGKIVAIGYDYVERPGNSELRGGIAKQGNKYALLDSLGSLLTPFIYDKIEYDKYKTVDNGIIVVKKENKWGALDYKGNIFISLIYDEKIIDSGKILLSKKDKSLITLNNKGEVILTGQDVATYTDNDYFGITYEEGYKKGIITYLGNKVILPDSAIRIQKVPNVHLNPGIAAFELDYKKFLVVDSLGTILFYFPHRSAMINRFKDAYSVSYIYNGNGKLALIDQNAKLLTPFEYDDIEQCKYGLGYFLIKSNLYEFIDKDGHSLISSANKIEEVENQGRLRVYTDTGVQLYDYSGKPIEPLKEDIKNTGSWTKFQDNKTNRYGYKDKEGKVTIPCDYDYLGNFVYDHAIVRNKKKVGLIDRNNNLVIPLKYNYIDDIKEDNVLMIKKGDEAFFTDFKGKIISDVYNDVWQLMRIDSLRYTAYYKDGRVSLLNGQANVIVPTGKYDDIDPNTLPDQVLRVERQGYLGYINAVSGEVVVPCQYRSIKKIKNGYLVMAIDKYGLVRDGKEVIACKFDQMEYLTDDTMLVNVNGLWGVVNLTGDFIIPAQYESLTPFEGNILIAVRKN